MQVLNEYRTLVTLAFLGAIGFGIWVSNLGAGLFSLVVFLFVTFFVIALVDLRKAVELRSR